MSTLTLLFILPLLFDGAYAKRERLMLKNGKCYGRQSHLEVPLGKCLTPMIIALSILVVVIIAVIAIVIRARIRRRRPAYGVRTAEEIIAGMDTPPRRTSTDSEKPREPLQNPEYAWLAPRTETDPPSVAMPVPTEPPPAKLSTKE